MVERELIEVVEGKARILVPNPKLYSRPDGVYEPSWAPVFYNPKMMFNRDFSIVFLNTLKRLGASLELVVDPLAGSGVRGIRYLLEVEDIGKAIINDIDPEAYSIIEKNVKLNNLNSRVETYCLDANLLLNMLPQVGLRGDFIDVDPFGSPIPFIDSALWATKNYGYLAATATDTAALVGTHERACIRRYHAKPLRCGCEKEIGLRILISSIILRAASKDIAAIPIIAYFADYYYRVFFKIIRGARRASKLLENLGYIVYDREKGDYWFVHGYPIPTSIVKDHRVVIGGPLWTSILVDIDVLKKILEEASRNKYEYLDTIDRIRILLKQLECETPIIKPYYRLDKICSMIHKSMPKTSSVIECLKAKGYRACRSHFDYRGIRTNAPLNELIDCISSLSTSS